MTGRQFYKFLKETYKEPAQPLYKGYTFRRWWQKNSGAVSFQFNAPGVTPQAIPVELIIAAWDANTFIDDSWLQEKGFSKFHGGARHYVLNHLLLAYRYLRIAPGITQTDAKTDSASHSTHWLRDARADRNGLTKGIARRTKKGQLVHTGISTITFAHDRFFDDFLSKAADLTQKQLADTIGLNLTRVVHLRHRRRVDLETFGRVCDWLSKSPDEYFEQLQLA